MAMSTKRGGIVGLSHRNVSKDVGSLNTMKIMEDSGPLSGSSVYSKNASNSEEDDKLLAKNTMDCEV